MSVLKNLSVNSWQTICCIPQAQTDHHGSLPIVLFTYRKLGKEFFIISIKSMLICSFMIDYVICCFPIYYGSRLAASILAGITSGIGYSLLFNEGSSTGGTDFIIGIPRHLVFRIWHDLYCRLQPGTGCYH